ncbi:MAG TPA: hypothetical protein VH988_01115 [Thermoanaerobaculia bacterium]|jgi:hypothetical protein|nr:hypothetical protein [Thermoanaerobaculia bacterium]
MSRRKRGAAGREAVAADGVSKYSAVQQAYQDALVKLWGAPPEALAEQTAVVLGKLLDYQEAFKLMLAADALNMQKTLVESRDRAEAEAFFQLLVQKLVQVAKAEEDFRADRVICVALVLAGRKSSSTESREWTH